MKGRYPNYRSVKVLFFACFLLLAGCNPQPSRPPNVVIIFVDDQGYNDLGCYGAKGFQTPNIDRMATEGLSFTNFYVSEAVCSASRASLLTGCYAQRVSIRGALNPIAFTGLNPEETTLASVLRSRGYKTAIYGKWHLGHRLEFLPANFGFDEYFGLPYSNDMWPVGYDGLPEASDHKSLYPELELLKDSIPVKTIQTLADQSGLTTWYTQKAVEFIYRNRTEPFFLYVPHSMVHVPLAVSEKFSGQSEQGMYGDVMMEIDWSVGEILEALKDNKLEDNTIVIYTSDNGPWLNYGNHAGSAYPLREGKGTAWEGGVRVPCIIRWPDKISGGRVTGEMATTMDILPTIASMTGASLPEKKIDGYDLSDLMFEDTVKSPRDEFFYYYQGELRAVRQGKWKLLLPHQSRTYEGQTPGSDGFPGPSPPRAVPQALYDLKADVGEQTDVSMVHPEVVERLNDLADSIRLVLGDALKGMKGREVRPCGRVRMQDSLMHAGVEKQITLTYPPNARYSGQGPGELVNGHLGSYDFLDDRWLGFRDEPLEATIDLGVTTENIEIKVRFLRNQISWIFLPATVSFYASEDGVAYRLVSSESLETEARNLNIGIQEASAQIENRVRYIRVRAEPLENLPDWHPGLNHPAWLFVDEIIVAN